MIINFFNIYCSKESAFGFEILNLDIAKYNISDWSLFGIVYDNQLRRLTITLLFGIKFGWYF